MRASVRQFIIDAKNYDFSPFEDSRGVSGFSGQLLVATHKKTGHKLLVKHNSLADVINEFVTGFLAEHLNLSNPMYYLFKKSSKFSCGYAVGIDFIDPLHRIDTAKLTSQQASELIAQVALNMLVIQSDIIQTRIWNDHVISYDFSSSFNLEGFAANIMLYKGASDMNQRISSFKDGVSRDPELALHTLNWPDERLSEVTKIYNEWLSALLNLNQNLLSEVLAKILPAPLTYYYNACVSIALDKIQKWQASSGTALEVAVSSQHEDCSESAFSHVYFFNDSDN